jgi:hypothetical protein
MVLNHHQEPTKVMTINIYHLLLKKLKVVKLQKELEDHIKVMTINSYHLKHQKLAHLGIVELKLVQDHNKVIIINIYPMDL